jgi:hypothetical protein
MHLVRRSVKQLVRLQVTRSSKSRHCTGPYTRLLTTGLSAVTVALAFTVAHGQQLTPAQTTATGVVEARRTAPSAEPLAGPHCFDRPYAPEKRLVSNQAPTERKSDEPEPNGVLEHNLEQYVPQPTWK